MTARLRHHVCLTLAVVLAVAGARAALGADPFELTVEVDGVPRVALVHPGSTAGTTPTPVILFFHGFGGNARNCAGAIRLHEHWPGATVVYPQGMADYVDATGTARAGWQSEPGQRGDRDLAFVDALLASLGDRFAIDEDRIYAGGYSNGGFLTFVLMVERGEVFAGFAPVAAFAAGDCLDQATQTRPAIYIFGRQDRVFDGDAECASLDEGGRDCARRTLDVIKRLNKAGSATRRLPEGGEAYLHALDGAATVWYLHPGGHVWPGFASETIVAFLRAQRRSSPSQAFVDPAHFAVLRHDEPCGDGGVVAVLRNTHPLRVLRIKLRVERTPGGASTRSVALQPQSEKRLGCTRTQTGSGDVRLASWSIVEATLR